jgi:heme exporter protein B
MTTPFMQTVLAIIAKDLRAELRSRELISSMALFALLSIFIFSFALELDRIARREAISGVLWVTIVYASVLGLNRSLALEREQGSMNALLVAPVSRAAIFCGKLAGNFIFALLVGVVLMPLMTVLYNVSLVRGALVGVVALGTLGFSIVGTLLATMTVQTRARESLLPIIMLPVALPVILSVVRASAGILDDAPAEDWLPWVQILAVVDVIYLVLCLLLFEYVVEE